MKFLKHLLIAAVLLIGQQTFAAEAASLEFRSHIPAVRSGSEQRTYYHPDEPQPAYYQPVDDLAKNKQIKASTKAEIDTLVKSAVEYPEKKGLEVRVNINAANNYAKNLPNAQTLTALYTNLDSKLQRTLLAYKETINDSVLKSYIDRFLPPGQSTADNYRGINQALIVQTILDAIRKKNQPLYDELYFNQHQRPDQIASYFSNLQKKYFLDLAYTLRQDWEKLQAEEKNVPNEVKVTNRGNTQYIHNLIDPTDSLKALQSLLDKNLWNRTR